MAAADGSVLAPGSAGLQFINSTSVEKANSRTRKLIRSHVMQGKNKVKPNPLKQAKPTNQAMMVDPSQSPQPIPTDTLLEVCYSFIHRKVGSDSSFTHFADDISQERLSEITLFFQNVMKYMFPLGEFISIDHNDRTAFELMASDASFLHVTAFLACAFIDKVLRQQDPINTQETILHFLKGVRLLREKLLRRDEEETFSDATVSVVLILANCAYGTGDYETARRHLEGLYKIVKLRGGLNTFKNNFGKKLLMEMLRCDIGISLHTSSTPIVFADPSLTPFVPYPDQTQWMIGKRAEDSNSKAFLNDMDAELSSAWLTMQKFCSLVSLAMETQRMFSMEIVLDTMGSVMYRLLHMNFLMGSADEAIRLGLLAMGYCIFLQWQEMELPSSHFPAAFKSSIRNLENRGGFPERAMLWLLMVGGISIFSASDDAWLKDVLKEQVAVYHIGSWNEVREILKSFIWISPLHDKLDSAAKNLRSKLFDWTFRNLWLSLVYTTNGDNERYVDCEQATTVISAPPHFCTSAEYSGAPYQKSRTCLRRRARHAFDADNLASLLLLDGSSLVYRLLVNLSNARKSGLPYIIIPWNQDHILWLVTCVPLRPYIQKYMPKWVYDRASVVIQGHEFYEKLRSYEQFAAPQGNDKSYAMVTLGPFEIDIRDPEIISEVLRRPREFVQMDLADVFLGRIGPNVLTSNGDAWARQRKVVASVINERISKTVFSESIRQTQGLLDEVVGDRDAGATNRIFDMMRKITINVLSGAGMGTKVEWNDNSTAKPSPGYKMTYNEATKHIVAAVVGPIILPQWFLENYPSFLPGYGTLKSLSIAMKEFPIHTRKLLEQERHRTVAAHGEATSNILSQLLQASEQDSEEQKGSQSLSEPEMVGNLFVFTAAGFDTTANTLAFAIVLLARYPKWQEWVFEEIDSIIPATASTDLDYASIFPKLIRIQALLFEVLRLFPPGTHIVKVSTTPQRIHTSHGIFSFPANCTIYINTVCLHLDPDVWRNLNLSENEKASETDELEFRPTRWICGSLAENQQLFKPPKGTYVPWSAGPRVCPGQKMAQVEFTAIFLKLFQRHRIEAVRLENGDGEVEMRGQVERRLGDVTVMLTLQMSGIYDVGEGEGLKLRLVRRR